MTLLRPLALLVATGLLAQEGEPSTLGVQGRLSKPETSLRTIVGAGDFKTPGMGVSLVAEMDLTQGYRLRLDAGLDQWGAGNWSGRPGVRGKVTAYHLMFEGVVMLHPGRVPSWGPYALGGLGATTWNVEASDASLGRSATRRTLHLTGTVGVGFRVSESLDVELKAFAGRIDPSLFASAILLGATYRY